MKNELTIEQVREWLTNKENVMKCKECPMNEGFDPGPNYNRLKCGQYHCWVTLHISE